MSINVCMCTVCVVCVLCVHVYSMCTVCSVCVCVTHVWICACIVCVCAVCACIVCVHTYVFACVCVFVCVCMLCTNECTYVHVHTTFMWLTDWGSSGGHDRALLSNTCCIAPLHLHSIIGPTHKAGNLIPCHKSDHGRTTVEDYLISNDRVHWVWTCCRPGDSHRGQRVINLSHVGSTWRPCGECIKKPLVQQMGTTQHNTAIVISSRSTLAKKRLYSKFPGCRELRTGHEWSA